MVKKRISKTISTKATINVNDSPIKFNHKINLKKLIRKRNPNIFQYNNNSSFIYESRLSYFFYNNLEIKSLMKPTSEEKKILESLITKSPINSNDNEIYVLPFFKILMDKIEKIKPKKDIKTKIIEQILKERIKKEHISLKKIKEEFDKKASIINIKSIQKSSIHNIMKKILGYKYLKTTIKNSKLTESNYIKESFFFIKVILRALGMGLEIIFIDESGFFTQNNHFRCWRKKGQEIYSQIKDNKKVNLIMAVNSSQICHYKLNDNSTTSHEFKLFMDELISKLSKEEKNNSIFVLDNLSSHLTEEMFSFYNKNNLKILFNVPYKSTFNMIEIVFRNIKNLTYKKLYSRIEDLKNDIKAIIEGDLIKSSLGKLFKETLKEYQNFINDYSEYNLENESN